MLPCPYAKKCGGCSLQNLPYEEQLHLKQAKLIKLLGRFGRVEEIIGMEDPTHYRNKIQAAFRSKSGKVVEDMNAADALRNTVLYAAREDFHLAEGQYFISDAIGLPVLDTREGREGDVLGVVEDILPNAASDIYTVKTPDGAEVLVPAIPVFIKEVIPGECVRMAPIDGMFENRDAADKENG